MPSRTASWISICYHPILFGTGCLLFILYRFFPYLFSLLVKSSPVIGFTIFLLGLLLIYGEENVPAKEEDGPKKEVVSSSELGPTTAGDVVMKGERRVDRNVVNRRTSKGAVAKETVLVDRVSDTASNIGKEDITNTAAAKLNNEKVFTKVKNLFDDSKPHVDRPADGGNGSKVDAKQVTGLKPDMSECNTESLGYDSSVASSRHPFVKKNNASSDSESDIVESSNCSVAGVLSMLDELDPLLDSDAPPTAQASKYNSDDGLSAYDRESYDGSTMEEAENQEDEDDDDETQDEKDEASKVVVKWTADDQRNLVDLGKSELERNRRLENLIARRRQRKITQHEMERNLIDLDGNDSLAGLNGSNGQIPPITISRMNPFDLPYDDEDIPGSAPSILLPRRNPFDLPFDSLEPSELGTATSNSNHQQEFVAAPRDVVFRRHESFSVGFGDTKQDRRYSKFRPYFEVVDATDSDERSFTNMHELSTEIGDLRANFAPPPGLVPSVTTNEENRAVVLQDSGSSAKQNEASAYQASQSLEEDESLAAEQESTKAQASEGVRTEQDSQTAEAPETNEDDTRGEMEVNSNVSDAEKPDVIDEEYDSGSSSAPETDEMCSKLRAEEQHQTEHSEESTHDSSEGSNKEVITDNKLQNEELEQVHDNHIVDPVYDYIPKSLANGAPIQDEAPSAAEKEDSTSDAQASASSGGLHPKIADRSFSPEGDEAAVELANWVASPSLASVDKIESISREITLIKERDILGDGLSRAHVDYGNKFVPFLQESAERQSVLLTSMTAVETETREGSS